MRERSRCGERLLKVLATTNCAGSDHLRRVAQNGPALTAGFNLYMIKAVLSGHANEVIDLARTNLFR